LFTTGNFYKSHETQQEQQVKIVILGNMSVLDLLMKGGDNMCSFRQKKSAKTAKTFIEGMVFSSQDFDLLEPKYMI
jgi:hypothetical protein